MLHNDVNEGFRLRKILFDKKMKVQDFADQVGIAISNSHRYFNQSSIKKQTLERFCKALDITLDEFYNWNNRSKNNLPHPFIHQGRRLQELIDQKGLVISKFATSIGISRRGLYNLFDKEEFSDTEIKMYARKLGVTVAKFLGTDQQEANDQELIWKEKYYALLEKYNALLESINHKK